MVNLKDLDERLFPTFWSCAELEDGGGVGPALLVPRLDYHLQQIHNFNTFFLEKDKILMKNIRIGGASKNA